MHLPGEVVIGRAKSPPPGHFQNHENHDSPCISYDFEASRPPSCPFQNDENVDRPMHSV